MATVDTLIFWFFVAAWAIVLGTIAFIVLPRIIGEVRSIIGHIVHLVSGSPLPARFDKADADVARIEAALALVPMLQGRVGRAVAVIKRTPRVPPKVADLITRVRIEVAAFRAAL